MISDPVNQSFDQFLVWVRELEGYSESCIEEARGILENGVNDSDNGSPEEQAELALRQIAKKINDVMSTYDKMLESMSLSPTYQIYFEANNLTDDGWRKLVEVIKTNQRPSP